MSDSSGAVLSEYQVENIATRVVRAVLDSVAASRSKRRRSGKTRSVRRTEPMQSRPSTRWQPWMDRFLVHLEHTDVVEAVRRSGIARSTVYKHKRRVPAFSDAWDRIIARKDTAKSHHQSSSQKDPQDA